MNGNAADFWQRVKNLIKAQNTTQEWLAKSTGINFSNMKQQIFHKRMPSADDAVKIAAALGTTAEYLVTGSAAAPKADTSKLLEHLRAAMEEAESL